MGAVPLKFPQQTNFGEICLADDAIVPFLGPSSPKISDKENKELTKEIYLGRG